MLLHNRRILYSLRRRRRVALYVVLQHPRKANLKVNKLKLRRRPMIYGPLFTDDDASDAAAADTIY